MSLQMLKEKGVGDSEIDGIMELLTDPELMDYKEQLELVLDDEGFEEKIREARELLEE